MNGTRTIAIVDYGAGNLRSIHNALKRVCLERSTRLEPTVTSDAGEISRAAAVVLPGVGAAKPTMLRLREAGLVEPLREAARERPFLGVCLGLQLLFAWHAEGDVAGLDVLDGEAALLKGAVKLPHIGWNRLYAQRHPMFDGIEQGSYFYYVHSYKVVPSDLSTVIGTTDYGEPFSAAIASDRLWATQFHPEKSGASGLRLLANFIREVEAA